MKKIIFIIIYCGILMIGKGSKFNNQTSEMDKHKRIKIECVLVDNTEEYCKKVIPMISKKKSKKSK